MSKRVKIMIIVAVVAIIITAVVYFYKKKKKEEAEASRKSAVVNTGIASKIVAARPTGPAPVQLIKPINRSGVTVNEIPSTRS